MDESPTLRWRTLSITLEALCVSCCLQMWDLTVAVGGARPFSYRMGGGSLRKAKKHAGYNFERLLSTTIPGTEFIITNLDRVQKDPALTHPNVSSMKSLVDP